ncbi:MAG: tetratricopeptide repeat protein, partial [Gemmatimonadetes bacterium]|nr:tetratricopeptide repeat protein [Gemmatimonadota bacterium]
MPVRLPSPGGPVRMGRTLGVPAALAVAVLAAACSARSSEESSIRRGDEAFALGKYDEALAEYRLAVRQGADEAEALARVAHTYAVLERVDDAGTFYEQAVARDSSWVDQAVADLMHVAETARARRDRFAMASAVETAGRFRRGIGVSEMSLDLARHYFQNGEYGRALPFYEKALAEVPDSATAQVVFEVGQAYEEIGDCQRGLVFFERYLAMGAGGDPSQVNWHIGTCGFALAREIRSGTDVPPDELDRALRLVDRTLELGEPRSIVAQAWFEKALILSDLGDCSGAMEALLQVGSSDSAAGLAVRARAVYDELRFG